MFFYKKKHWNSDMCNKNIKQSLQCGKREGLKIGHSQGAMPKVCVEGGSTFHSVVKRNQLICSKSK